MTNDERKERIKTLLKEITSLPEEEQERRVLSFCKRNRGRSRRFSGAALDFCSESCVE